MRQIHNPDPKHEDKFMKELTEAGITAANRIWLVPYLDTAQAEDPALLENAVKQSAANLTKEQCLNFASLLDRLVSRSRNDDYARRNRAVKAFFSIFGVDLMNECIIQSRPWLTVGSKLLDTPTSTDKLLGPGAALALKASYWQAGVNIANSLKQAKPEVIEDAITYCTDPTSSARIVLACLWLAQRGGVLSDAEKAARMTDAVKQDAAGLLAQAVPSMTPSDREFCARFICLDPPGALPPKVRGSIKYLASRSYVASGVGGALFYAMETAPSLQNAFLVYADLKPGYVLRTALELAGVKRFQAKMSWLVQNTEFYEVLDQICNSNGFYHEAALYAAQNFPEQFDKAMRGKDYSQTKYMQELLEEGNPDHFHALQDAKRPGLQKQAAVNVAQEFTGDQKALENFILHGTGLDALLSKTLISSSTTRSWAGPGWSVLTYAEEYGLDSFLARAMIGLILSHRDYSFYRVWNDAYHRLSEKMQTMETVLEAVHNEGMPALDCLIMSEWEDQHSYSQKDKDTIMNQTVSWMLKQPEELLTQAAAKGSAYARTLAAMAYAKKENWDALLSLALDSSKQVKKAVVDAFAGKPFDQGPKAALTLLQSKKAAQRETGILILFDLENRAVKKGVYAQQYRAQLEEALSKEKSVKLANALRALLGLELVEADGKKAGGKPSGDPVAEVLKGGKKRKVQWVLDATQQLVSRAPGGALENEDRLAAVLVCCMQPGALAEAKNLASAIDSRELAAFAGSVYDYWLEQGAVSKQKWVLTFASVFGGHDMVDILKKQINQWPLESRGAIACEAVNALALSPEPDALLVVDSISRKFKFKQVKAAAGKALDFAAQELGLSAEELADRIVPDLGLDQRGQRVFNYGSRSFTVTLTPALELEVCNQDGKKVKSMPAPGKQDDPELAGAASAEFKTLKKQIKTTVSTQSLRLEQALSTGRIWTGEGWRALFVEKPIMRQFAVGLVWAVYGDGGAVEATFRYLEDGSFNTADEDEYELSDSARVGLVHPVELSKEDLDAWRQQLEDYEIKQPILQLERPVARVAESEKDETSLGTFGGRMLNDMSLTGKLLGMGWYRGSVQDAGGFYDFYREDGPIGAQLNFSGSYVGGGMDDEVEVFDIQFYRSGTVQRGSYVYDTLGMTDMRKPVSQQAPDQRLFKLGEVPERLFSEIVYQVQKATASSTETRSDWKSRT